MLFRKLLPTLALSLLLGVLLLENVAQASVPQELSEAQSSAAERMAAQRAAAKRQEALALPRYVSGRQAPDAVAIGLRIQDAALQVKLGSNLRGTVDTLDDIWMSAATAETYMQQASTLAALSYVRASCLMKLGDFEAARAALQTSYLTSAHRTIYQQSGRFKRATADQIRVAKEHRQNLSALQDLAAKLSDVDNLEAYKLRQIIKQAYDSNDLNLISQIGEAGFEALAQLILADIEGFPLQGVDPLIILVGLNMERAGKFISKHFHDGGILWKRRILLVLKEKEVQLLAGIPNASNEVTGPAFPAWVEVVRKLVATPDMATESVPLVKRTLRQGAPNAAMQKTLLAAIDLHGEGFLGRLLGIYGRSSIPPLAFLRKGAKAKSQSVRFSAATKLARMWSEAPMDVIESLLQDESPEVRYAAAFVFGHDWDHRGKAAELLVQLTRDEDAKLRLLAVERSAFIGRVLPTPDLRRLVKDPSAKVRAALVRTLVTKLDEMGPELVGELMLSLARDDSEEVLGRVDTWIRSGKFWPDSEPLFDAVAERLVGEFPEGQMEMELFNNVSGQLLRSKVCSKGLANMVLSASDEALVKLLGRTGFLRGNCVLNSVHPNALTRARLIIKAVQGRVDVFSQILSSKSPHSKYPYIEEALSLIVRNKQVAREIRLEALDVITGLSRHYLSNAGHADLAGLVLALLEESFWDIQDPVDAELHYAGDPVGTLEDGMRNDVVLKFLQSDKVSDKFAIHIANYGDYSDPSYGALVLPILGRWFESKTPLRPVGLALEHSHLLGKDAPVDFLFRAAASGWYIKQAEIAMAKLGRQEFGDVLGISLTSPDLSKTQDLSHARLLVRALREMGTDEAIEYLIAGLNANWFQIRELCGDALDELEERRARLARWEDGFNQRPSKEAALQELLALLEDDDPTIRALAVRGIGAFGAVEYIPQLIGMLKQDHKEVKEVREAVIDAVKQLSRVNGARDSASLPADKVPSGVESGGK